MFFDDTALEEKIRSTRKNIPPGEPTVSIVYPAELFISPNFGGKKLRLRVGEYPDISQYGVLFPFYQFVALYPFTLIVLYGGKNFTGPSTGIGGPFRSTQSLRMQIGLEKIQSVKVSRPTPADTAIRDCCSGSKPLSDCGEYIPGSSICENFASRWCRSGKNNGDPYCKRWCGKNDCDVSVAAWCSKNKGDPYCACLESPALKKGENPGCIDGKCLAGGYLTQNMKKIKCPSNISCTVQENLLNTGIIWNQSLPVVQNCGKTDPSSLNGPTPKNKNGKENSASMSGEKNPSTSPKNSPADKTNPLIVLFFFLLIFIVIAYIGTVQAMYNPMTALAFEL